MKRSLTVCAVLFCAVLLGMAFLFWLLPKSNFSETEKRALNTAPAPTLGQLCSGAFAKRFSAFFADHLPFRQQLIALKGTTELGLGKGENNGILYANGRLARRLFAMRTPDGRSVQTDRIPTAQVEASCNGLIHAAENLNVPFVALLTGRNLDACPAAFSYPLVYSDALQAALSEQLNGRVNCPDLIARFRKTAGDLYYHTDHHWTTEGAYLGYCAAMEALGSADDILPESDFRKKIVSTSFRGSLWSAIGAMPWIQPDTVTIWHRGNEQDFTVTADGRELDGFYQWERLNGKDHYALFLDGTHDVVTVQRADGEKRPVLLILRDSFGSSIAPFLAQHYDLVLLNLSSTHRDLTKISLLAEEYRADAVLLVYTLENLLTSDKLSRLS